MTSDVRDSSRTAPRRGRAAAGVAALSAALLLSSCGGNPPGVAATVEGDTLRTLLAALRRVLKPTPVNVVRLRRQLAEAVTAQGKYVFG